MVDLVFRQRTTEFSEQHSDGVRCEMGLRNVEVNCICLYIFLNRFLNDYLFRPSTL